MVDPAQITGLVLAGGAGQRMGGLDKGLQRFHDRPLVAHVLRRLAPQVSTVCISANRHLDIYASLGAPFRASVLRDGTPGQAGPLAGMLSGLRACRTPWLLCVPCDSPLLPLDLARQLATTLQREQAQLAIACTPATSDDGPHRHPVFCLMRADLRDSLQAYVDSGQRRVDGWGATHRRALVLFDDAPQAFRNLNTLAELRDLEAATPA